MNERREYDVIVIGAGVSGIYQINRLVDSYGSRAFGEHEIALDVLPVLNVQLLDATAGPGAPSGGGFAADIDHMGLAGCVKVGEWRDL